MTFLYLHIAGQMQWHSLFSIVAQNGALHCVDGKKNQQKKIIIVLPQCHKTLFARFSPVGRLINAHEKG
jgi:hypothetical protein